jgi:hypothetical protein
MLKITRLDRRYNGYTTFKYIVEVQGLDGRDARIQKFKDLRAWLWETFGPGCELGFVRLNFADHKEGDLIKSDERWAWDTEYKAMRLYIKTDSELTLLKLKWS